MVIGSLAHAGEKGRCVALRPDAFIEECAVFGIAGPDCDAAKLAVLGLHALQHRGQTACGIASCDASQGEFRVHRKAGLVGDVFSDPSIVEKLTGTLAVGHARYKTAGDTSERNIQPLYAKLDTGACALAHNGNLTNAEMLREKLIREGSIFQSSSDTEIILHLIAREKGSFQKRLINALRNLEGSWALAILTPHGVFAIRDPYGLRPLVLGALGNAVMVASESCAFDIMGGVFLSEIAPGELIHISPKGKLKRSQGLRASSVPKSCLFELIYFSRPDSIVRGRSVYEFRKRAGQALAETEPVDADMVVPIMDSGMPAAVGYAERSSLPLEFAIIRNHYVGRTFIEPEASIRHLGVRLKHNANRAILNGKRVVLVDDSIVRGTTSRKIVNMVRCAGAREVHLRVASPPTLSPCYYGVDTPSERDLLACKLDCNVEKMCQFIGTDSLAFVSLEALNKVLRGCYGGRIEEYCHACFSKKYPTRLTDLENGKALEFTPEIVE